MRRSIFLFIFIFNLFLIFDTYGYWSFNGEHHDSEGSTSTNVNGHYDYSDVIMTEDTSKRVVKMTQDDEYYYFDVTMYISRYFGKGSTGKSGLEAYKSTTLAGFNPVVADFSDIYALYFFNEGYSSGTSSEGSDYNTLWLSKSNNASNTVYYYDWGYRRGTTERRTNNIALHGIGFKGGIDKTICKSGETHKNVKFLSNSSTCTSNQYEWVSSNYANIESASFTLKCKVGVAKEDVMYFRYLSFLSNEFLQSNGTTSKTFRGYSASVNTSIDLSLYTNCEHNWVRTDGGSRDYHILKCNKCMWMRNEPHLYQYEYDNILCDKCECGEIKEVKIRAKDNINFYNLNFLASPSGPLPIFTYDRPGYTYKYVEVERKNEDGTQHISTASFIPPVCPYNSTSYNLLYDTHSYFIKFNKTNNCDLDIGMTMDNQEVKYGEHVNLNPSIYNVKGYAFLGWAVMPDLNTPIFDDEQEIYNISEEDGFILNLYPVYKAHSYTVTFTSSRGVGYMAPQHFTYGVEEDIKKHSFILDSEAAFQYWTYNGKKIEGSTSKFLEKYINDNNQVINLVANVFVRERNEDAGYENSPYHPGKKNNIDIFIGPGFLDTNIDTEYSDIGDNVIVNSIFNINDLSAKNNIGDENNKENEDAEEEGIILLFNDLASRSNIISSSENTGKSHYKGVYLLSGFLLIFKMLSRMVFCSIIVFSIVLVAILLIIMYKKHIMSKN